MVWFQEAVVDAVDDCDVDAVLDWVVVAVVKSQSRYFSSVRNSSKAAFRLPTVSMQFSESFKKP